MSEWNEVELFVREKLTELDRHYSKLSKSMDRLATDLNRMNLNLEKEVVALKTKLTVLGGVAIIVMPIAQFFLARLLTH